MSLINSPELITQVYYASVRHDQAALAVPGSSTPHQADASSGKCSSGSAIAITANAHKAAESEAVDDAAFTDLEVAVAAVAANDLLDETGDLEPEPTLLEIASPEQVAVDVIDLCELD